MTNFDSLLVSIWKDTDWTSNDVIRFIKPYLKPMKVGHAGTLDPFAEGVLLVCIGKMTKEVSKLMELEKEYIATIKFGYQTDTLDNTGKIVKEKEYKICDNQKICDILNKFVGDINQIPPMFSALKYKGQRLYNLARKGIKVNRDPRKVSVYEIELIHSDQTSIDIKIRCGKGTYIRSLARDISSELNTCGHLSKLTRTKIGDYDCKSSINVKDFKNWILSKQILNN